MTIRSFYILLLVSLLLSCKSDKEAYAFQISGNLKNYGDEVILLQNGAGVKNEFSCLAEVHVLVHSAVDPVRLIL